MCYKAFCTLDVGNVNSSLFCSSQADKEHGLWLSATVEHTKHLVTDLLGCTTIFTLGCMCVVVLAKVFLLTAESTSVERAKS